MWFLLRLTANLQASNTLAWQQERSWTCAVWLWTELEAERPGLEADRGLTHVFQRWTSAWPWRLVLCQGESQGGNDWLPFPATALLLNWAGLLDLSECTRLRAPRRHLLKQLGVNCWKCVSERGKRCYNSDVLSEFIVELKQISRELIKVQSSIWDDDSSLLFGSWLWMFLQLRVFANSLLNLA